MRIESWLLGWLKVIDDFVKSGFIGILGTEICLEYVEERMGSGDVRCEYR